MFDGKPAQTCLPGFNSYKVCQVTRAKWQGRTENVKRLKSSPELMMQLAAHPEWLPVLMDSKGEQEPFPLDDDAAAVGQGGSKQQRKKRVPHDQSVPLAGAYPYQAPLGSGFMFPPEAMAAWQMANMNMAGCGADAGGRGNGRGRGRQGAVGSGRGKGKFGNAKTAPTVSQAQWGKAFAGMAGMPMPMNPMNPMMGAFPPMVFGDQSMLNLPGMDNFNANAYLMPNFFPMMPGMEAYANLASTNAFAGYSQMTTPEQEEDDN